MKTPDWSMEADGALLMSHKCSCGTVLTVRVTGVDKCKPNELAALACRLMRSLPKAESQHRLERPELHA